MFCKNNKPLWASSSSWSSDENKRLRHYTKSSSLQETTLKGGWQGYEERDHHQCLAKITLQNSHSCLWNSFSEKYSLSQRIGISSPGLVLPRLCIFLRLFTLRTLHSSSSFRQQVIMNGCEKKRRDPWTEIFGNKMRETEFNARDKRLNNNILRLSCLSETVIHSQIYEEHCKNMLSILSVCFLWCSWRWFTLESNGNDVGFVPTIARQSFSAILL